MYYTLVFNRRRAVACAVFKEDNMKCPYCKKEVEYKKACRGDITVCPHCEKRIIFSMPLFRSKKTYWAKPMPYLK